MSCVPDDSRTYYLINTIRSCYRLRQFALPLTPVINLTEISFVRQTFSLLGEAAHQLSQDKHQDVRQKRKKLTSASWLRPVCGGFYNPISFNCAPFFSSCRRQRVLTFHVLTHAGVRPTQLHIFSAVSLSRLVYCRSMYQGPCLTLSPTNNKHKQLIVNRILYILYYTSHIDIKVLSILRIYTVHCNRIYSSVRNLLYNLRSCYMVTT
jgi:hypothetical protein